MRMIFWGDKPFGRLVIILIVGIVLARYFPMFSCNLYIIFAGLFSLFFISVLNKSRNREYITGFLLLITVFSLGYTRYISMNPIMDQSHYSHQLSQSEMYISAKVLTIPKKTTRYSSIIEVKAIGSDYCQLVNTSGKMSCYFKLQDSIAETYSPGDEILVHGYVTALRHSRNPNAFDFNDYLKTKHIYYRIDVNPTFHIKTSKNLATPIELIANKIRSHALSTFDKYLDNKDHNSLAGAMVLGFRNTIDPELYASYTKTGAVHVLAVSGLHVGIICQLLLFFLNKIFKSSNRDKLIKISILGITTLTYVIITGGSPAVMRASAMILLYFIAKYWANRVNSYNVISMAAFLLLVYDPYMLFQASFQFSFLALLSIIYFYRSIYEWPFNYVEINYISLNFLWQMIALSLSAQILVAPLTVYYFHKFPTYFWLSGIVAVPAAYAVLILGIAMIICEFIFPAINVVISFLLNFTFEIFIKLIRMIENLPYAVTENIWLYTHELIILLVCMYFYFAGRKWLKPNYILVSSMLLLVFSVSRFYYMQSSTAQSNVTIYDNYKGHIIDFYDGRNCYTISSKNIEDRTVEFITSNNRVNKKIETSLKLNDQNDFETKTFIKSKNLIQFKNESILLLDSNYLDNRKSISVNTAIVIGGMKSRIDTIQKYICADQWIITQSQKGYKHNKWEDWCRKSGYSFISIKDQGAYDFDIN